MRLKCIKLAGFKSFVDPTTVDFPGNLSAVVGPNGCGKSNIIDAVRWVMGESSAKNLRGESMTDVIFNGSTGRKAIGQASIELVFDNTAGEIGGEYATFAEISIKRRVTRESQNHYFLNGQKCRRRDITDIFLGTGLGPRSYAIIEQGMISRLIESKPEELRIFIEEAAGISKYKERRKETENRMRRTLENLERLTDIRDELGRQLQHLQRQSQAAEKFTAYKAEERLLTAQLQALQWQDLDLTYQNGASEISQLELDLEALVTQQTSLDTQVEDMLAEQTTARDQFNTVQARFYSIGAEIARAEQVIQNHKERQARLSSDLTESNERLEENRLLMQQDSEEMEILQAELLDIEPELEILQESEEQAHESQADLEERLQQWQDQWDEFNAKAAKAQQKVEVEQSKIQHSDTVISRLTLRSTKLQAEIEAVSHKEIEDDIAVLEETLLEMAESVAESEEVQLTLQASIEDKRAMSQQHSEKLDKLKSDLQSKKGRLSSLEALQQAAFEDSNDVLMAWLKDNQLAGNNRIADSLIVEEGWEEAVETVLSNALHAICVESLSPLSDAINQVNNADVCLITEQENTYQSTFKGESLFSKVKSNHRLSTLLSGIFISGSLNDALSIQSELSANESLITPEGLWIGPNWVKKRAKNESTQGFIKRKAELEALQETVSALCQSQEQLQVELSDCMQGLTQAEKERDLEQQNLKQLSQRKNDCQSQLSSKKSKIEQMIAAKERLVSDLQDVNEQMLIEQETTSQARALLEDAIESMQTDVETRDNLTQERDHIRHALETARQKYRQDKEKSHQLAMQQQSLNAKIDGLSQQKSRVAAQLSQIETRKAQLEDDIATLTEPDENLETELEVLLDKRLVVESELAIVRDKVESIDEAMRKAEQQRAALLQQNHAVRGQLEKSRIAAQGIEVKRDTLQKQLEENEFDLEQIIKEMPEDAEQALWQQNLEKLASRINRLGAINLAAIDEYKQASERKDYLDQQNEDLEKALNTLENAIKKIDRETRSRFKDTFDKINAGIQELFPKVFGGGKAYLEMTGEDLLDTGIAIMAQPPGKKNSTIHLLSGGEKALTAISLVFSIFRLNPAPFCMLDEVDAPLDDANVGRYARMVQEMSAQVQFIYITHNKIAMEMASHLLGVTMHEPGVSRMVTVNVEEAAELAAM